ncbi:putative ribonuclease H-like domain-containing protein, partial [Tanacetum coccineum]
CTQPKRPRNAAWFKEKLTLAEAHESGQLLDEEQLAFLADPGIIDCHDVQPTIIHNVAFQTNDLDAYDSDCDDISSVKAMLMADLSSYGSDVFSEIGKIMGYGDYQMGNVMISRVYYVEGLGHDLFSVGQFCDSDLEIAFRKHTCYIRDLEGVDLLKGSRGLNLYTLSLEDMMLSSPICLLSKTSKINSWLWHRSKKHSHKPKAEDSIQEKLYLLHMDLCGPMRIQSINGYKYILVIVDDYSRFTWVKFLRLKDKVPEFVIKFLKTIQVCLNAIIQNIRTDNGTEFVNQTLRAYYEDAGISHQKLVARTP